MDDPQFDNFTRAMASGASRRKVLQSVGGGLASALGGLLGRGEALADSPQRKCKGGSRPCSFDAHCCSELCCNHRCCYPGEFCNGNGDCEPESTPPPACAQGQHCSGGRCCDAGFVACPGNPLGCIRESTACSGDPVCCDDLAPGAIVCGFQGQCQPGSAPPPATCPTAG